jgi:hypothetical protein
MMENKLSTVKGLLVVFLLLCALLFFPQTSFAWVSSADEVTLYSIAQSDSTGWYYGDDVYAYNGNDFPVFIDVHLTQYDNVQFSVGGSVDPGETRKIGWIVCADSNEGWSYSLDWSWQENARAF